MYAPMLAPIDDPDVIAYVARQIPYNGDDTDPERVGFLNGVYYLIEAVTNSAVEAEEWMTKLDAFEKKMIAEDIANTLGIEEIEK